MVLTGAMGQGAAVLFRVRADHFLAVMDLVSKRGARISAQNGEQPPPHIGIGFHAQGFVLHVAIKITAVGEGHTAGLDHPFKGACNDGVIGDHGGATAALGANDQIVGVNVSIHHTINFDGSTAADATTDHQVRRQIGRRGIPNIRTMGRRGETDCGHTYQQPVKAMSAL
jgi:hypothetical protein